MSEKVTRLSAKYVLAWTQSRHVYLEDAQVVWRGPTIVHVGGKWVGRVDEEIDAKNSIVLPGLIDLDALADIDHCLLDSWEDPESSGGYLWSKDFAATSEHVLDASERATMREYALAQLARHGVTTYMPIASEIHSDWAETYDDLVEMSNISERIGLRGYLGPSYRYGVPVYDTDGKHVHMDSSRGDKGLDDARRFLEYAKQRDNDLIHGALLPCRIETQTFDSLKATAALARRFGVHVRLHCLQSPYEKIILNESWGLGVIDSLEKSGLLDCSLLIPHGHELGDLRREEVAHSNDVRRLVSAEVPIIYCPLTSSRYGHLLQSFEAFEQAGLKIVLGSDSFPPDLIRGIDVGVQLAKIAGNSLKQGNVTRFLESATSQAAEALGRPDLGRIAPGASADLIIAGLDDFAMGTVDDPVKTLIVNGTARDINRTVVRGETIMKDGMVLGVKDMGALKNQAQQIFKKMKEMYTKRDYLHREAKALFPPSFPTIDYEDF